MPVHAPAIGLIVLLATAILAQETPIEVRST